MRGCSLHGNTKHAVHGSTCHLRRMRPALPRSTPSGPALLSLPQRRIRASRGMEIRHLPNVRRIRLRVRALQSNRRPSLSDHIRRVGSTTAGLYRCRGHAFGLRRRRSRRVPSWGTDTIPGEAAPRPFALKASKLSARDFLAGGGVLDLCCSH